MKQLLVLSILLSIFVLALAGCGGRPAQFQASAKLAASPADPSGSTATPSTTPAGTTPAPSTPAATATPSPSATAAPSSSLPTPPSSATVFNQIQNATGNWQSCALCAQGTNVTTSYWMAANQTSPSMTGSSREFFIGGPKWSNALFIKTYDDHFDATHFLWDFYVYWDPTSMSNIWSAEFDFWQVSGGKEFMVGSQCNFGDGYWDIWDQKANQWLHSDVRCPRMEPNKWHHIQWSMERDNSSYRYDTLVVDGKSYAVNRTFSPSASTWRNSMGVQWQLDKSSTGVDIHEWVDNVKLTVW